MKTYPKTDLIKLTDMRFVCDSCIVPLSTLYKQANSLLKVLYSHIV